MILASLATAAGCSQSPGFTPKPESVYPAALAAGESHYLVIYGRDFYPEVGWSTMDGEADLDFNYSAGLPGLPADRVFVLGEERMVARFSPGEGASTNWYDLSLTSPTGQAGKLSHSVCVSGKKSEQLLFSSFRYQAGAVVGSDLYSYDYTSKAGPWKLIENALPNTGDGFALSPDGNLVAYYRMRSAGQSRFFQLVLARLGRAMDEIVWEKLLDEIPINVGDEYISPPAFSPDSRVLAFIENGRRLLAGQIPQEAGQQFVSQLLVDEPAASGAQLFAPDISPDSDTIVYSRVSNPGSTVNEVDKSVLYRVSLSDPHPAELVPAASGTEEHNSYATFLPLGDKVLFLSDSLHMLINSPYGMLPVTGLQTFEVAGGRTNEVIGPAATVLLDKPTVSPDGRWAACQGFLSDESNSGIDLLLINLQNGAVFRTAIDPAVFCDSTTTDPANCPTLDVAPAFDPASKQLWVTAVPYTWQDNGREIMEPAALGFYQYLVDLPDLDMMPDPSNATIPASYYHRLPALLDSQVAYARLRELVDCSP